MIPQFKPFTKSDWDTYNGAERFSASFESPLIATIKLDNGFTIVEADVVIDNTGCEIYFPEGDHDIKILRLIFSRPINFKLLAEAWATFNFQQETYSVRDFTILRNFSYEGDVL